MTAFVLMMELAEICTTLLVGGAVLRLVVMMGLDNMMCSAL
jgi:hypothetical protein